MELFRPGVAIDLLAQISLAWENTGLDRNLGGYFLPASHFLKFSSGLKPLRRRFVSLYFRIS